MTEDVKKCVDARINSIEQYFTIPPEIQGEVDGILQEMKVLGESCQGSAEFEEKFAAGGLMDRFNALFAKLKPKSFKMTKEQKDYSKQVMKQMIIDNKEELAKDFAKDVAGHVMVEAESELIAQNRKRMIEEGTMRDYTVMSNRVNDAGRLASFVKGLFKK